jgi:hypothetical protein
MDDEDLEGYSARLSAWRALLYGPVFLVRLHMRGFRLGRRRHRRWILAELATGALWVYFVFALSGGFALWYHVGVMAVGQCMTSFFAVWTVHHDCDRSHQIARTLRGKVKNRISFEMFFHLEHHSSRKCRPVTCPGSPTGSTAPFPNCKPIRSSEPEPVSHRAFQHFSTLGLYGLRLSARRLRRLVSSSARAWANAS